MEGGRFALPPNLTLFSSTDASRRRLTQKVRTQTQDHKTKKLREKRMEKKTAGLMFPSLLSPLLLLLFRRHQRISSRLRLRLFLSSLGGGSGEGSNNLNGFRCGFCFQNMDCFYGNYSDHVCSVTILFSGKNERIPRFPFLHLQLFPSASCQ